MSGDQGFRLRAELDVADRRGALDHLLGRVRGPNVIKEVGEAVSDDVVLTHDGRLLFAYADSREKITAARGAIDGVLEHDGITATIVTSEWDERLDEWRQIDPPLTGEEERAAEAHVRDAETVETRTMVANVGKEIRAGFDQSLLAWANQLGVKCEIVEHPHLLSTQTAYTVTGPRRKLEEFDQGLKAEEAETLRTERAVMLSPL